MKKNYHILFHYEWMERKIYICIIEYCKLSFCNLNSSYRIIMIVLIKISQLYFHNLISWVYINHHVKSWPSIHLQSIVFFVLTGGIEIELLKKKKKVVDSKKKLWQWIVTFRIPVLFVFSKRYFYLLSYKDRIRPSFRK